VNKLSDEFITVKHPSRIPGHPMHGDWAWPGMEYSSLSIEALFKNGVVRKNHYSVLRIKYICAKPGDFSGFDDFEGERFEKADIQFPLLVVRNMPNPCQTPYRLIDGRRRLEKLRRMGRRTVACFVLEVQDVVPFIKEVKLDESC